MKLSVIVRYLNLLDTLSIDAAASASVHELDKITQIVQAHEIQIPSTVDALALNFNEFNLVLQRYRENLKKLRADIFALIEKTESEYFVDSTNLFQQDMRHETPEYILNRTRTLDTATEQLICERSMVHTGWQYPGLVIRPAHSPGLNNLVALDPLYLVDTHEDLLDPVKKLFTPQYQRRLRYYVIDEYAETDIFWNLPRGQFGLVYAFHFFDFKPLEILEKCLTEIFALLRPGGTVMFSFNDCDYWKPVTLTENHFCCYVPGRLVRKHAVELGYDIVNTTHDNTGISWIELRKPGTLDSLRGGQALASIFRKTVDKPLKELYNAMELDQLVELAEFLKVDISEAKTKREFNIKKVRNAISAHLETENYPEETLRELFKPKET